MFGMGTLWQPMKTAPHDGRDVILLNRFHEVTRAYYIETKTHHCWCIQDGTFEKEDFFRGWIPSPKNTERVLKGK